jgi:hypothetical protein
MCRQREEEGRKTRPREYGPPLSEEGKRAAISEPTYHRGSEGQIVRELRSAPLRYWHKADVLAAPVNVRCRGASWTSVSDCPRSANDPMARTPTITGSMYVPSAEVNQLRRSSCSLARLRSGVLNPSVTIHKLGPEARVLQGRLRCSAKSRARLMAARSSNQRVPCRRANSSAFKYSVSGSPLLEPASRSPRIR